MNSEMWTAVDQYANEKLLAPDAALDAALADSAAAGLPAIAVAPNQGKLLHLLAKMCGAKKILEIGTLGGYSSIWLARALPADGKLITLEYSPKHAEVARKNIERAGLAKQVEIHIGKAIDSLPRLQSEKPFDFFFIDADKASMPDYFAWALKLSRSGSVMFFDNVVRKGEVVDSHATNADVLGVRRLNDLLAAESRITATTIQTVGSKGYDGFTLAIVK